MEGDASRFEALLTEYLKAPRVTRDRLYLDAIEEVYGRSAKVILDSDGSGNLLYLPVDQLLKRAGSNQTGSSGMDSTTNEPFEETINDGKTDSRDRRVRQ